MSKRTSLFFSAVVAAVLLGPSAPPVAQPAPGPHSELKRVSSRDGLSHDAVHAIAQDHRGFLWIGTERGLNRYDGERFAEQRSFADRSVTALHEQRGGQLWAGTESGLYRLLEDDRSFAEEEIPGRPRILELLEGEDGALWIATESGLYRREASLRPIDLDGAQPIALEMDAVGNIWVVARDGDDGATLHRLPPDGSSRRTFSLGANRADFYVSASGEMWFDLEGPIDERDFPLTPAPDDRLPTAFAAGEDGRIWIGTRDGLYVNDGSGHLLRRLADAEVLAAYRDRAGRLWFGTREGLLYGRKPGAEQPLPPPVLTGLSVSAREGRVDRPRPVDRLELEAGVRAVEFEYVGIEFDRDREVRYRHLLAGFDASWTDAGSRRSARYTNLPPGNYRFRVQATSDGDFDGASEAALTVLVRAPFHATLWFRAGALLVVAAALVAGYRAQARHAWARGGSR